MKMAYKSLFFLFFFYNIFNLVSTQDYEFPPSDPSGGGGAGDAPPKPPKAVNSCNGVFLTYIFTSREKEYPHLKNATAQSWSFKSMATILNTGDVDVKAWNMYIGFQHKEILVSAGGAVLMGSEDFPADVSNGTTISGYPQADLKTAIETAGDMTQIQAQIEFTGTMFGLKPPAVPMPKNIKLENDGFKCPKATRKGSTMYVCCVKDKKYKAKSTKIKFSPRQYGDLNFAYDVIQSYEGKYQAQVTMDNNNPLGRLDRWNLTWEWMRGEFIYSMKGAYTPKRDPSDCLYSPSAQFYQDLDFSQVMNCQKKPFISDLPPDRAKDEKIGNIPNCCKNGTLLPVVMNESQARSIFQLEVFKIPPDMNKTALYPPQNWKIDGILNPTYKCGAPVRVDPSEFPDPSGLAGETYAIATWQIVCNITKPKDKSARCCVSFSAYYNASVVPCNTCACGCPNTDNCNPNAQAMLLPSQAQLVPFENRTSKAKAWARLKKKPIPNPLPCPDNCGVSINWHINSDFRKGWTARITLFNWIEVNFEDWFAAVQLPKAYKGFEKIYSFNGTELPDKSHTIFFQGLKGLTFLMGEVNGTNPEKDPRVPGKQQSVVSFTKKETPGINVAKGDGFPKRVFFNGEECSLPKEIPIASGAWSHVSIVPVLFMAIIISLLMIDPLHCWSPHIGYPSLL